MASNKPILVTGAFRTGTTFTGKMLALASNVGYVQEPFNFIRYRGIQRLNIKYWYTYINETNEEQYFKALKEALNYRFKLVKNPFTELTLYENIYILKCVCESVRNRLLHLRPLFKDPIALFSAPYLSERFEMEIVILIRNPVAFVSSFKSLNWTFEFNDLLEQQILINKYLTPYKSDIEKFATTKHNNLEQAILLWKIIYSTVVQFKTEYPNWNFLRHEDMSDNPIEELKNLYSNLGLVFTKKIELKIREYTQFDLQNDPIRTNPFSYKRNSQINKHFWKSRLTEYEIYQIKKQTWEIASNFYSTEEWLSLEYS